MAESKRARFIASVDEDFDMRGLIRLGAWGLCALAAVVVTIVAGRSDVGARRAAMAFEPTEPPAAVTFAPVIAELRTRTSDAEHETRRLSGAVQSLNDDHDRTAARLASIERDVRDMNGSLTRALATLTAAKPAATPEPKAGGPEASSKPETGGKPAAAASEPKLPVTEAAPSAPIADKAAMAAPDKSHAAVPAPVSATAESPPGPAADTNKSAKLVPTTPPPPTPPASIVRAEPTTPPAAQKPEPVVTGTVPVRLPIPKPPTAGPPTNNEKPPDAAAGALVSTSAPPNNAIQNQPAKPPDSAAPAAHDEELPKVEIGLDLGPALTLARLRSRWNELQSKHRTLIEGMRPLVALRETGKSIEIRLVIGPVADIQAASEACSALTGTQFMCQPAVFDGQRLGTR